MRDAMPFEEVSALLRLDGGLLFWRDGAGAKRAGKQAGHTNKEGYIGLCLRRRPVLAHRVVWLLANGQWPAGMLDHINGNRADNRIENLRLASRAQNQRNRKASGATGLKGVTVHTKTGRFQAYCGSTYLGLFVDPLAAARAYDGEASKRYGEYARLNFGRAAVAKATGEGA